MLLAEEGQVDPQACGVVVHVDYLPALLQPYFFRVIRGKLVQGDLEGLPDLKQPLLLGLVKPELVADVDLLRLIAFSGAPQLGFHLVLDLFELGGGRGALEVLDELLSALRSDHGLIFHRYEYI